MKVSRIGNVFTIEFENKKTELRTYRDLYNFVKKSIFKQELEDDDSGLGAIAGFKRLSEDLKTLDDFKKEYNRVFLEVKEEIEEKHKYDFEGGIDE